MTILVRIIPQEVYPQMQSGKALLVCAYADEAKCRSLQLEGSLTFQEFQAKLPGLSKDQEIVFYCA